LWLVIEIPIILKGAKLNNEEPYWKPGHLLGFFEESEQPSLSLISSRVVAVKCESHSIFSMEMSFIFIIALPVMKNVKAIWNESFFII